MQKPAIISQSTTQLQSTSKKQQPIVMSTIVPPDRQEYLNAGLSTAFVSRKNGSVYQGNQISIMKTIQSSVMKSARTAANQMGSVMSAFPVGSVMS